MQALYNTVDTVLSQTEKFNVHYILELSHTFIMLLICSLQPPSSPDILIYDKWMGNINVNNVTSVHGCHAREKHVLPGWTNTHQQKSIVQFIMLHLYLNGQHAGNNLNNHKNTDTEPLHNLNVFLACVSHIPLSWKITSLLGNSSLSGWWLMCQQSLLPANQIIRARISLFTKYNTKE